MTRLTLVLAALLLVSSSTAKAEDATALEYGGLADRVSVELAQEIDVGEHRAIAARKVSLDLVLSGSADSGGLAVTVERVRASYTAHEMEQRLGARHIVGRVIPLTVRDGRRLAGPEDPSTEATVPLDAMVEGGLRIGDLLVDVLPVLPDAPVGVGTVWTSARPIRTLEGWAWATGLLRCRHRVTGIELEGERVVVSVESEADAELVAAEGGRGYEGELTRTLRWRFEATGGRLLDLTLEQETRGEVDLPRGRAEVRQSTRLDLVARAEPEAGDAA